MHFVNRLESEQEPVREGALDPDFIEWPVRQGLLGTRPGSLEFGQTLERGLDRGRGEQGEGEGRHDAVLASFRSSRRRPSWYSPPGPPGRIERNRLNGVRPLPPAAEW